jgi:hypothetical protein
MHFRGLWKFAVALFVVLSVSGCGDGNSNTNGTLSLSASAQPDGSGGALMIATANVTTVKPAAPGIRVDLTAVQSGTDSVGVRQIFPAYPATAYTDSTGKAVFAHRFIQQPYVTSLQLTATCEGLASTIDIPIPAFP